MCLELVLQPLGRGLALQWHLKVQNSVLGLRLLGIKPSLEVLHTQALAGLDLGIRGWGLYFGGFLSLAGLGQVWGRGQSGVLGLGMAAGLGGSQQVG